MNDAVAMRHLGCTESQGYYFSQPVAADALDALVRDDEQKENMRNDKRQVAGWSGLV